MSQPIAPGMSVSVPVGKKNVIFKGWKKGGTVTQDDIERDTSGRSTSFQSLSDNTKVNPPTLAVYNRHTHATTKTATVEYNQAPCCRGSTCAPLRVVRLSAIGAEWPAGVAVPERVQERRVGGRSRERWRRPADTRESQLCRVPSGPV